MLTHSHHYLRDKYRWYHLWHTHPHHSKIHWGLLVVYCLAIVLTIDIILFTPNIIQLPKSADQSKSITTQADWQAGGYDSATDLTTSAGDIKIKSQGKITFSSGGTTANYDSGNKDKVFDNDTATYWNGGDNSGGGHNFEWNIDLSENYSISKFRIYPLNIGACTDAEPNQNAYIDYSLNGTDYTNAGLGYSANQWSETIMSPSVSAKYLRLKNDSNGPPWSSLCVSEFEAYTSPLTATHTTAAGQIGVTGESGRYVADFLNFTASENEADNSDIRYRFRKTDSSGSWTGDWTDYVDYTGSAINLQNYSQLTISEDDVSNGRTYIQVETKITRADASAAPTVSDYSIGYHTNKRPNKPTGN